MRSVRCCALFALLLFCGIEVNAQKNMTGWGVINEKWVVCDQCGRKVSPRQYDKHGEWIDYVAWVSVNDKYGVVDLAGREILPLVYDDICTNFLRGKWIVRKEGKWGIVDKEGKIVLPFVYDNVGVVDKNPRNLISMNIGGQENERRIVTGGKWGFINHEGVLVIPVKYDYLGVWKDELLAVNVGGTSDGKNISGGMWGLMDRTGREVVPSVHAGEIEARMAYQEPMETVAWKRDGLGTWMLFDKRTKKTLSKPYDKCGEWRGGKVAWVLENQKYGFVDKKGKEIIPTLYDDFFSDYFDTGVLVKSDGKFGYVNWEGKLLLPCAYDIVGAVYPNGLISVNAGGKINEKGWVVGGKWGYINTKGELVLSPQYDYVGSGWQDGAAWVNVGGTLADNGSVSGGKFGIVDDKGEEVVPVGYASEAAARNALKRVIEGKFEIGDFIPDKFWNY